VRGGKEVERSTGVLDAGFGDGSSEGTQGGEKSG
jgi:hypothetical protein